ncbi:SAP-like protein BP-73 [Senna tora]|uniref:SAP-like protein BP-73 n=1 Tax=Senna tora TaxID=362788 RepID=A0A834W089_9FABA|nr:SAP-like protein BP-73 [Senna tora]
MMQAAYLVAKNVPGCGVPEGRHLPYLGVSGRTTVVYSCSYQGHHKVHSHAKTRGLRCAIVCEAKRNPEFSRQNKHGFSRSKNRHNEGRDNFENFEEDMLSSKNGPLISLSSIPKSQATATPGTREKEIVELFRKVQARLRERAAIKEEKKVEASKGQGKENGTVDSLLKLLRKHSVEQGKRGSGGSRGKDFSLNQLQDSGQNIGVQGPRLPDLNNTSKYETQEATISTVARPPSNFQRRSPVPRLKYQPVSYAEDDVNEIPLSKGNFQDVGIADSLEDDSHDSEQNYDDEHGEEQQVIQHEDLSALKLAELRALAKSRGLKGFSKMKKGELMELLNGS